MFFHGKRKGQLEAAAIGNLNLTPEIVIVSPLTRTLQTASIAFQSGVKAPLIVREEVREVLGKHVCDQRRSISVVREEFPSAYFGDHLEDADDLFHSFNGKDASRMFLTQPTLCAP